MTSSPQSHCDSHQTQSTEFQGDPVDVRRESSAGGSAGTPSARAVTTRRRFLQAGMVTTAGLFSWPQTAHSRSPNERVRIAAVGVGGKGWTDVNGAAKHADVVAFCDVQEGAAGKRRGGLGAAAKEFSKANAYVDWREMLDKEHKRLDGITVSTPDHMHAPVTMTALHHGLACYTQKPLTRTIHEARQLATVSQAQGVATQMGNQHHNGSAYRTLVKLIRSGVIGKIREAHAWSNRPIWPQGLERPTGSDAVPKGLHWNLWLGVAAERPFLQGVYHPFNWRGWYDFGAGALGDMGCHIIDPVVWSMKLGSANSVTYEGPPPMTETFPKQERLNYIFPGTEYTEHATLPMSWYDGGQLPSVDHPDLPADLKLPSNGTMFVGQKGIVITAHGGKSMPTLYPQERFGDVTIDVLPSLDHYGQWIGAIRGEAETTSHFGYSGPLTETVLLGTIACRFPSRKLDWDPQAMQFPNHKAATQLVNQPYRDGWEVPGLSG